MTHTWLTTGSQPLSPPTDLLFCLMILPHASMLVSPVHNTVCAHFTSVPCFCLASHFSRTFQLPRAGQHKAWGKHPSLGWFLKPSSVSVCQGVRTKYHKPVVARTMDFYCLTVLEPRNRRSEWQQGHNPSESGAEGSVAGPSPSSWSFLGLTAAEFLSSPGPYVSIWHGAQITPFYENIGIPGKSLP